MERDNLKGTVVNIPLPCAKRGTLKHVGELARQYFVVMREYPLEAGRETTDEAKRLLVLIDAEIMRLYDLPPKMEKRVLDLFQGVQRRGVDFRFTGYYPEGFESAVPLHEYLSEEYQRSTITFADEWVKKHRSTEMSQVLRRAVEAFEE